MLGATLLTWAGLLTSAASLPQQEEVAVEQEAKFTSPPVRLMVNQGSSFRLPCTVEDIGAFILLWKAGGTILSVGERVVVDQTGGLGSRLSLHQEGQALLVKDAIPEDAGEYTCQVNIRVFVPMNLFVVVRLTERTTRDYEIYWTAGV